MREARGARVLAAAALGMLVLAGCVEGGPGGKPEPSRSSASPSPTPSPTASEHVFTLPTECETLLPAQRLASFASDGLVLLGGPGGVYGTDYFFEPTPEEQAGGLTCVWGDDAVAASTITVSVAPLSAATRDAIVADLLAQGLTEVQIVGAATYGQVGDDVSTPAVLNVLRDDSWISVIEAVGGETRFERATELVDEVATQVYRTAG